MSRKDPDQLALPLHPDDGDQQELIRSAQQHLAALRTARRLGLGAAANRTLKQKDVEIVGLDPQAAAAAAKDAHHHGSLSSRFARVWRRHGGHAANGHEDEEEVDDSWFRVDDEEARRTVKLSIGKVPKRAAALVGRTVSRGNRQRRSRRHQGRGDEIVSDDGGGLDSDGGGGGGNRYELKGMDTAQRGGDDTFARRNRTYTHRHHHHNHLTPITTTTTTAPTSENEDADDGDSFVTLELPARFGTGGGGGMGGSNAAFPILGYSDSPNGSLSRIVSPASPSSRSATLFPVDSIASAGGGGAPLSSSGSASGGTPLYNKQQQPSQQQQILTVDEVPDRSGSSSSSSRPKISRKTTALTMTSGSGVLTDAKDKDKDKDRDDNVDASSRVIETPQSKSPRLSAHRKLHKHHRPAPSAAKHHHPHHPPPHHPHRHHQNSKNKGKDLAAETSGATAFELQVAEALKKAGVIRDEEERVESDVLWEHQRGLVVFGLPKFSGNALFQADPPQWCDASFKPSPFNPHTFPCKPYWVWRDSEFMIDMSGDKDEEGWSYAFRFRSHYWRGEPQPIRSFVRRRRWIRTRVYRPEPLLSGAVTHAHALRNALGLAEVAAHPELGPCGANPSRSPSPSPAPSPCGEEPASEPIHDLRTACAALPIADDDKVLLFADSSSPAAFLPGGAVDPRNPFISFRQIKIDAAASMPSALAPGGQKASDLEPMWREAVREINYRRAIGVMRARTRVDRQRVELFRLWFGEYDAASKRANRLSVAGGDGGGNGEASASAAVVVKADGTEGAHETAQKEGAKAIMAATRVIARKERSEVWDPEAGEGTEADVDDVWDVVEHRLDDILLLFDYQLSRQTFLTMLLDIHPVKHAYHRYRGYDASSAQRKATLERGLETRLAFYETAMELVRQYGGKGGWMPEPGSPLDP